MAKADDASSTTLRSLLLEAVENARSSGDRAQAIRNLERLGQTLQRFEAGIREVQQRVSASRSAMQSSMRLTAWMLDQIQAAKRNPKHKAARVWLGLLNRTPKQIAEMLPYLIVDMPDLRVPRRKGRQKGRVFEVTSEMVEQLDKRIKHTGEKPTTAARHVLTERGHKGNLKGRADALVRRWKK